MVPLPALHALGVIPVILRLESASLALLESSWLV